MTLVLGTDNGLYTVDKGTDIEATPLSEDISVFQLEARKDADGAYAATGSGVYNIDETGMESIGLTDATIVSIHETATGDLYAGTRPAHLYRSADRGATWEQSESFEEIPGKENWTQNYMGPAQVRDIRTHKKAPWKLFVAIETDSMYVSPDGGQTWEYRGRGLDNDPHGLCVVGQDSVIATCGRGLYRTDTAGRTWYRLDTHQKYFWYQYFREGIVHDGVYYTSVMDRSTHRYRDVDDGLILFSSDGGETFADDEYPGHDEDYVTAWATDGEHVFGGTVNGRLLRGPDEWAEVETVEATIRSITNLSGPE